MSSSLEKRKSKNILQQQINQREEETSIFRNDILLDIQNIQMKSSKRSHTSSTKRKPSNKPTDQKQQKQVKQKQIKNSYTTFSKLMDQKNILIATQQKQIQNLKMAAEKYRKQYDSVRVQTDKKKVDDLSLLKKYERENEYQIKQVQKLRIGMKELKTRTQLLEQEKTNLLRKNNNLLEQNEQITLRIATIKEQNNEDLLRDLKEEVKILKQQSELTKQLERQNKELQERCIKNQNRINEYMMKYNESQTQVNEYSNKYYALKEEMKEVQINNEEMTKKYKEQVQVSKERYTFIQNIQMKSQELITQNERINRQFKANMNGTRIENEKKQETLELQICKLKSQLQGICRQHKETREIRQKQREQYLMNTLQMNNKISVLESETQEYQITVNRLKYDKQESQKLISSKINIIQHNLQEKKSYYDRQAQKRQTIIREKQELLVKLNKQLREIKEMVINYKSTVQNMRKTIQQLERQLTNEQYLRQQETSKYEEQIQYYKNKYNNGFNENLSLSDKICQLQRENTQQVNSNTQMMKKLQEQAKCKNKIAHMMNEKDKIITELKSSLSESIDTNTELFQQNKQIQHLNKENSALKEQLKHRGSEQYNNTSKINALMEQNNKHIVYIKEIQINNNLYIEKNNKLAQEYNKHINEIRILSENLQHFKHNCYHIENKFMGEAENHKFEKKNLEAELFKKTKQIQEVNQELKAMQEQLIIMNRSILEENKEKDRKSNREMESLKVELSVLREQNNHLQNIMDQELSKRKVIIEDLIREKKILYDQLTNKN